MTTEKTVGHDGAEHMAGDAGFTFADMARGLTGAKSGNLKGNIWFCGLEEGGGLSLTHPNRLYPYPPEYYQAQTLTDFLDNFWYPKSAFCLAVAKFLLAFRNRENGYAYHDADFKEFLGKDKWRADWDTLQREGLAGPRGLAMVANAYPLSMPSHNSSTEAWARYEIWLPQVDRPVSLRDWVFAGEELRNFEAYCDRTVSLRREWLKGFWKRLRFRPRLILSFGYKDYRLLAKLFGVADPDRDLHCFESTNETLRDAHFRWWLLPAEGDLQETLVCVLPFPSNWPTCLHNEESYTEIVREIERIFGEQLGLSLAEALALDDYRRASADEPGLSPYDPQVLTDLFSQADLADDEEVKASASLKAFVDEEGSLRIAPRRQLDLARYDETMKRLDRAIDEVRALPAAAAAEASGYLEWLLTQQRSLYEKRHEPWLKHCRAVRKRVRERFLNDEID